MKSSHPFDIYDLRGILKNIGFDYSCVNFEFFVKKCLTSGIPSVGDVFEYCFGIERGFLKKVEMFKSSSFHQVTTCGAFLSMVIVFVMAKKVSRRRV